MLNVKGIIFDLDRTLVDLNVDWDKVRYDVEQILGAEINSILTTFPKVWGTEKYNLISQVI